MSERNEKKCKDSLLEMLSKKDTAMLLGVSRAAFDCMEPHLVAHGRIKPVSIGKRIKYRKSGIIEEIKKCEQTGEAFYDSAWGKVFKGI